ncbi:MAG: hypothetical protein N2578_05560 [Bdellovibrionaceae bacterium]|nr:hypothetical protein [Pseudobdellovibrionaceae bacterium]
MDLETFTRQVPRPVLVFGSLILGVLFFYFVYAPPQDICDVQKENFEKLMVGDYLPYKEGKNTLPARIKSAQDVCYKGLSSGACYDYFNLLRKLSLNIKNSTFECQKSLAEISAVQKLFKQGVEDLALMAWGESPPDPRLRFGWLRSTELASFCHIRDVWLRTSGRESWESLQREIFKKMPGEKGYSGKMANQVFPEDQIRQRSIFLINCDEYR